VILSDPTLQLVCAVLVLLAPMGVVLGLGSPAAPAVVALAGSPTAHREAETAKAHRG